jgi:hypothetical protein
MVLGKPSGSVDNFIIPIESQAIDKKLFLGVSSIYNKKNICASEAKAQAA